MAEWREGLAWLLLVGGLVFFLAGSLGLLRFPDAPSRLHALTKADTLGLGLVVLGLACRAPDVWTALRLLSIWLLVLASSAVACQLLARLAREEEAPDD